MFLVKERERESVCLVKTGASIEVIEEIEDLKDPAMFPSRAIKTKPPGHLHSEKGALQSHGVDLDRDQSRRPSEFERDETQAAERQKETELERIRQEK